MIFKVNSLMAFLCMPFLLCTQLRAEEVVAPQPIVGGTPASTAEYPFQVGLFSTADLGVTPINTYCGASLIATDWVLTAAHCVADTPLAADIQCLIGTTNRNAPGRIVAVDQIIMHPNYDADTTNFDYALLHLTEHVYGVRIQPIRLPAQGDPTNLAVDGAIATVTGWGTTSSGGTQSDPLLEVDVPIVPSSVANAAYGGGITAQMIAAGDIEFGGIDSCQGDSGGPFFLKDPATGDLMQLGVVSFGIGCGDVGFPGIYSRVSSVTDWIETEIGTPLSDYPLLKISAPTMLTSATQQITLTFTEPVTNFTIGDLSVSGGSLSNLLGSGSTYTIDYTSLGTEGGKVITFTPGNTIDDDGLFVHWQTQDILVDDEIVNMTTATGIVALGIGVSGDGYAAAELGFSGVSIREFDAVTQSYIVPTTLDGTTAYWMKLSTAPQITAPDKQTSAITYIALSRGWNFFSISNHDAVAWNATNIKIRRSGATVTLTQAVMNGWVEDYAWWYDSNTKSLVSVNDSALVTIPGSVATLQPWQPYWFEALVGGCELVIPASATAVPVIAQSVKKPGAFPLAMLSPGAEK